MNFLDFEKSAGDAKSVFDALPLRLKESFTYDGSSCPAQWDGETLDGKHVYVRFRYGVLSVSVDGQSVWSQQVSDGLDGTMDTDTMLGHLVPDVVML